MNVLTVKKKTLFICEITTYIYEMGRLGRLGRNNVPEILNVPHVLKTFVKTAKPNFGARPAANFPVLI